ncbi:hypothetical protein QYF61_009472 [Mycteria americana]|uniref:Uncharacterized protein n=1 Tax=Mycteria americana TaxID=33587 RepID=A0AAN7PPN2_MYCAM|nr:hypothetical protein QYF61_009472 [Mycteria americana]
MILKLFSNLTCLGQDAARSMGLQFGQLHLLLIMEPILQTPPCNTEDQAGWFSAPSDTLRTGHAAAGASPITVPVRRVAEKNPFHWRVGSAVLLSSGNEPMGILDG